MKILPFFAAAVLLLPATRSSAQQAGVAVLDIDRVAKELNVDQAVLTELKQIEGQLNNDLNRIRNNMQSQMSQLESQAASQQRTQQLQQQLVSANQQLNQQFNTEKAKAQNLLAAERIKRINEFREKVKPIAQEVAKSRGLQVVLTKTPQVFAFAEEADITDAVIVKAREAGLEEEPPPAPAAPAASSGTEPTTPAPAAAPAAPAPTPAPAAPSNTKGGEKGKGKSEN